MKRSIYIIFIGVLSIASAVYANNATLTNLTLTGVTATTAEIEFDLSWENSWKLSWSDDGGATTVTNWDAVWVFAKYRPAGGEWQHVLLTDTGHMATGGSVIDVASNGTGTNVGAFVYRSSEGSGTMDCTDMRLTWDLAANGLSGTNDLDVSVHAIEMVYIPQGAFYVGSGGTENDRFYNTLISSEAPIDLSATGDNPPLLPASYPKGYNAFYGMKYEVTQGQYASFLNYLKPDKSIVRYPPYFGSNRYTIHSDGFGKYTADAPDRACNYLSWADLSAYLDWACLRPMTELEFEKACRGTYPPEPNEYAWGNTTVIYLSGFNGVDGSGTETALPTDANCAGNTFPVRVGIFAEPGSSRHEAGATYYGVLNMSGNVREWVVTTHTSANFLPDNGDGSLTTVAGWPSYGGMGMRYGQISSRIDIDSTTIGRDYYRGGRGVRYTP